MTPPPPPRLLVPQATVLHRVVRLEHGPAGALWFGPAVGAAPINRFDAPAGAFRVCYLATTPHGAFAESLLRLATKPFAGIRLLARTDIEARGWAEVHLSRALTLADLSGGRGLSALGATGALTMSDDHRPARAMSASMHASDEALDGIHFRLRFDPDMFGVALFDRAASALAPVTELVPLLDRSARLAELLRDYSVGIDG